MVLLYGIFGKLHNLKTEIELTVSTWFYSCLLRELCGGETEEWGFRLNARELLTA